MEVQLTTERYLTSTPRTCHITDSHAHATRQGSSLLSDRQTDRQRWHLKVSMESFTNATNTSLT